jgi:ABC-2 type transport system ATP-binding protein
VVLNHGRIVADGPATEIKAKASSRTIRATLPGVDLAAIRELPGVTTVERRGDAIVIASADAEEALRGLLGRFDSVRDLEVRGAGLDEAFLALTGDQVSTSNEFEEVRS